MHDQLETSLKKTQKDKEKPLLAKNREMLQKMPMWVVKIVSNFPVLFHAMMIPNVVPIKNAIIIEIPAKKIVQPNPLPMISETGAGK